jgi:hypothetical protein
VSSETTVSVGSWGTGAPAGCADAGTLPEGRVSAFPF